MLLAFYSIDSFSSNLFFFCFSVPNSIWRIGWNIKCSAVDVCKMIRLTEIGSPYISVISKFKDRIFLLFFILFSISLDFGIRHSIVFRMFAGSSIKMKLNQKNIEHELAFHLFPLLLYSLPLHFAYFLFYIHLNHSSILAFTNFPLLIFRSHFPFSFTSAYFFISSPTSSSFVHRIHQAN